MSTKPERSFLLRLRQSSCFAAMSLCLSFGCSQAPDTVKGSETHFLEACNMSCGSDLECVDGQCSKHCSTDSTCTSLNGNATCEAQPSGVNACEVGCSDDSDCTNVRSELTCNEGVCRGPLWQLGVDPDPDASSETPQEDAGGNSSPPPGSSFPAIECGEHPGCPPDEAMYFLLPEEGLGTVRLEFMFNLGEAPFTRCAVEFVDDEMTESSCETDTVAPAILEQVCPAPVGCSFGSLRFDVRPVDFELTYWQSNGHQLAPLDTTTWERATFNEGPTVCGFSCELTHLSRNLRSTKDLAACLAPETTCDFGLGCGDRASALANAPACDDPNASLLAGVGCGYDVLIYQRYIESERAFYDRETGALMGFWHRSDTGTVECSGQVPLDCTEAVEAVDICAGSDAGAMPTAADAGI